MVRIAASDRAADQRNMYEFTHMSCEFALVRIKGHMKFNYGDFFLEGRLANIVYFPCGLVFDNLLHKAHLPAWRVEREFGVPMPIDELTNKAPLSAPGGVKFDHKKLRFDLVPPIPLAQLAAVYTMGARKYEDRNWEKGFNWSRAIAALERHLLAFKAGQDLDPESGLPHMAHAAWNCFTLLEFMNTHPGLDDRVKCEGTLQKVLEWLDEFNKRQEPPASTA